MTDPTHEVSACESTVHTVIARAEALRLCPATRSDLANELDRGLRLAREGDPTAVDAAAEFR